MTERIDLTGRVFGRLRVISFHHTEIRYYGKDKHKCYKHYWLCECTCKNKTIVEGGSLRRMNCRSCGCLAREMSSKNRYKHGEADTRLYKVWQKMKDRCYNKNCTGYENYGGRGIKVYEEWKNNYIPFRDFMLSLGYDETLPRDTQTLERIDVNGNYEPSNCRLATKQEQNCNKRSNHFVTYKGVTKTITEFANEYRLDVDTIINRVNNFGYTIEEAIEKPVRHCPHKNAPTYEVAGYSKTLREWADFFGLTRSQLKAKIRRLSVEEVVSKLLKQRKERKESQN